MTLSVGGTEERMNKYDRDKICVYRNLTDHELIKFWVLGNISVGQRGSLPRLKLLPYRRQPRRHFRRCSHLYNHFSTN